jgi:hypothetical protein
MIILGTPSVTLDFGIPDWVILLVIGLMFLSYCIGRCHERSLVKNERDLSDDIKT